MNINSRYPFTGRDNKESKDIHIHGIDVGEEWRTGRGSHPHSATRVEELEDSVLSVVRQKHEREGQGEGVHRGRGLPYITVVRPTLMGYKVRTLEGS